MSSILKAIRKVEDEKRSGKAAAPDLMVDHGDSTVKRKTLVPLLSGALLGALIVGGGFLWPSREDSRSVVTEAVQPSEKELTVQQPPPVLAEPSTIKIKAVPEALDVPTVTLPPEPVAVREPVTRKPLKQPLASTPPKPIIEKASVEPVSSPPPLKAVLPDGTSLHVSEIFYQEDKNSRMAVVNDLPVMVGTTVDSAVVVDILPERVVFEVAGQQYRVSINKP